MNATRTTIAVAIALIAGLQAAAATRVYFIGNSVTDALMYPTWHETVEAAGHAVDWGRTMIPGAPIQWLWEHPGDGIPEPPYGTWHDALVNYTWDFVSLQPYDRNLNEYGSGDDEFTAGKFIDFAQTKSPDVQILLFAHYPRQTHLNSSGGYQQHWDKPYNAKTYGAYETRDYYEQLVRVLRKNHPDVKPVVLVPVGDVFYELDKLMRAGQFPGKSDIVSAAYSDLIHQNNFGCYIVGCTYYSVIFKKNPTDYSGSRYWGAVSDAQAAIIQKTVWSQVSTNPLSGVVPTPAADRQFPVSSLAVRRASPVSTCTITGRSLGAGAGLAPGVRIAVLGNAARMRVAQVAGR